MLDHNNSSLMLIFTHIVDEQAIGLHLLRKFHKNPLSINHKNQEILPQSATKHHEKSTCFVRGVLLTISAPSKGQACNAPKHKNRKRRAHGARAYAIHVRFLA